MMDPALMGGPPPDPGMGAPAAGPPGMMDPGMAGGLPPEGPPPDMSGGGGLPPELMAALGGGGGNSQDMLAEGPLAGEDTALADEPDGEDPLSLVREAIALLRRAGDAEPDDQRSHLIDKLQADAQKILASESQKTDKLRAALSG